jgi:hypothetical protein
MKKNQSEVTALFLFLSKIKCKTFTLKRIHNMITYT